jgi:O-antigen ligase
LAALLLAAAVAEAVLWAGGFAQTSQFVFAALALAALIAGAGAGADRRRVARLMRQPLALTLAALAVLGALSAAWTVAAVGDALRWALVAAAYAAVVVAAAAIAGRQGGVQRIAGGVCVLAILAGVIGVVAACVIGEPLADRIGGSWRPGGPLEYSAALALLEVSALPALLAAMCSRRHGIATAGVAGVTTAGAVLGLAGSRAEFLVAGLIGCAAIVLPRRTLQTDRRQAAAAVLVVLSAALLAHLIAGGYYAPGSSPGGWRLLALTGACALLCVVWLVRGAVGRRRTPVAITVVVSIALVVVLSLGGATGAGVTSQAARHATAGVEPNGGLFHGRLHLWDAALKVFAAHPLGGSGADSFILASARYQDSGPIAFAHDLPLELAAELGVGGLLLCLSLYGTTGAALWRARGRPAAWLLGPGTAAFLAAGLVDWPWHLAGSGAVWAACTGGVIGSVTFRSQWRPRTQRSATTVARMRSRSRSRSRSASTASHSL